MIEELWLRCPKCAWAPHGLPSHVVGVTHRCPGDYRDRVLRRVEPNGAGMDPKPRLERTQEAQAGFEANLGRWQR